MTINLEMVEAHRDNFPWTKFHTLMRLPEIYDPQWEDGMPAVGKDWPMATSISPTNWLWLVMEGSKAHGFVLVEQIGLRWAQIHTGFRPRFPAITKKYAGAWAMQVCFDQIGLGKLSAFVPEDNQGARRAAREMGFEREGYIPEVGSRNGRPFGRIVYGVTRDAWYRRFKLIRFERSYLPPEQPQRAADRGTERTRDGIGWDEWDTPKYLS